MIKDVMIGFPAYDNRTECEIAQELYTAVNDPNCCVGHIQYYNGDSLIPRGRNKIAKMFLDSEFKYLMFIDSDIKFHRSQINQLRAHDKGIVGGVYLKKTLPYQPVMNCKIADEGELSVMREIGTGYMMIRRDVLGAIKEFWPEHNYTPDDDEPAGGNYHDWFRVGVKNGRYLSEDYFFCQLAGELGIKTYLDQTIMVEHWGKMKFPMRDEMLVDGMAMLAKQWAPSAPIDESMAKKILELQEAVNGLVNVRKLREDQETPERPASIEELFKRPTSTADGYTPVTQSEQLARPADLAAR